jgi:hypothetical protein
MSYQSLRSEAISPTPLRLALDFDLLLASRPYPVSGSAAIRHSMVTTGAVSNCTI